MMILRRQKLLTDKQIHWLTDSVEPSTSWKADSFLAGQELKKQIMSNTISHNFISNLLHVSTRAGHH